MRSGFGRGFYEEIENMKMQKLLATAMLSFMGVSFSSHAVYTNPAQGMTGEVPARTVAGGAAEMSLCTCLDSSDPFNNCKAVIDQTSAKSNAPLPAAANPGQHPAR